MLLLDFINISFLKPWKFTPVKINDFKWTKKNHPAKVIIKLNHILKKNLLKKGDNFFDGLEFGHLVVSDRGTQFFHDPNDVVRVVVDVKGVVFKLLSDQVNVKHLTDLGPESHMLRHE